MRPASIAPGRRLGKPLRANRDAMTQSDDGASAAAHAASGATAQRSSLPNPNKVCSG